MRHAGGRVTLTVRAVLVVLVTGGVWGMPAGAAAAGGEADFVGLTPCRLVDTRGNGFGGAFGPPALATGIPRDFPLQGQCGIPATAVGVSLNVTATSTQGAGFLMLYPQGGVQPLVSTLNYVGGETVANAALVPLGAGGLTVVAGVSGTDLILDVDGYFTDALVHAVDTDNLFVGVGAGNLGTTGTGNTAVGARALDANTTGTNNTAIGRDALGSNTTASANTALGAGALGSTTTSGGNTGIGAGALLNLTTGGGFGSNTAIGFEALRDTNTGSFNTAVGRNALRQNTTGNNNIAIGQASGNGVTTGSHNILIGEQGGLSDTGTIRIGTSPTLGLQTRAFIAGIRGVTTGVPDAVLVGIDSLGQLGTASSSRRVKTDIEDIGERSRGLYALRPVSFRYRVHPPDSPAQYGLIAEEVAEVYPELVVRDAEGAPETVRYHLLPALLLNELQRLARELEAERAQRVEFAAALAELTAELARLRGRTPVAAGRPGEEP